MNNTIKFSIVADDEKSGRKVAEEMAEESAAPAGLKKWRKQIKVSTKSYYGKGPRGDYVVRLKAGGVRKYVPLMTNDLNEAAKRARIFFWDLKSIGWDAALKKLLPAPPQVAPESITIGEYFDHVESLKVLGHQTLHEYRVKMRTLVAYCMRIEGKGCEKWAGGVEGPTPWQKRIEAVKLVNLTPDLIRESMVRYRNENSTRSDPLSDQRAKHSINSLVRCARSAFSVRKVTPFLKIPLPAVLPFDGVKLFEEDLSEFRFVKEIEAQDLIYLAEKELKIAEPVQFMIFILCLVAGLRRNEADKLLWINVTKTPEGGIIEVAENAFFTPKSRSSLRKIRVRDCFYQALVSTRGNATNQEFVLPSDLLPKVGKSYRAYRCGADFGALCSWLKSKGLTRDAKKVHALRKLFGDAICNSQGIYPASKALGHQKVSTTEIYYVAPPDVAPAPFGLPL